MKKRYTLEQKRWDDPVEHAMPEHSRVPASFNIGNVQIAPAVWLAPRLVVTDTACLRFIRTGPPFIKEPSQFIAAARATDDYEETLPHESGCGPGLTEFTRHDGLSRS